MEYIDKSKWSRTARNDDGTEVEQTFIQPPHFSDDMESIARNVSGVSITEGHGFPVLKLERSGNQIRWQVGNGTLHFPASLVAEIEIDQFAYMGIRRDGLVLAFDNNGERWPYRMLTCDVECSAWLVSIAAEIAEVFGLPVKDIRPAHTRPGR